MTKETIITLTDFEKESLRRGLTTMEEIYDHLSDDFLYEKILIGNRNDFKELLDFYWTITTQGYFKEEN